MYKTSSNFRVSYFRNRVFAWMMLTVLCCSFMPSVTVAQQPTAMIKTLSGNVLVSGQAATVGTVLQAGDTIQTQAGASVVLELSDGSEIHLGENTQVTFAELSQTATGARVSRVKLLWGRIRAFLSPQHQIEGSSFDIETPNALVGVKFSEPDIEVSYNLEKAETVGIAHTVELLAKNLLTDEKVLVPVGSTVIITGTTMKVIAGIVGIGGASSVGSTGTGTASTTASTGSSGISTGTITVVGAAAAAGGVAAAVATTKDTTKDEEACTTAECTGDLSGTWYFDGSCVAQGCTADTPCSTDGPLLCGTEICDACAMWGEMYVSQSDSILSGYAIDWEPFPYTLNGMVEGGSVTFSTQDAGPPVPIGPLSNNYTGTIDGNTIRGTFSGSTYDPWWAGGNITWSGTFTVTIRK